MRDLEAILRDDLVRVEENVDVQGPLTGRGGHTLGRRPARPGLDRLGQAQEPPRREVRLDLDRAVEVPGLARRADLRPGRRLVDLGARDDTHSHLGPQEGQRRLQMSAAVSEVRAEREKNARHGYRLRVMRTPGTAATPSMGAVTLRTVTVTSRAGYSRRSPSQIIPARRSIRWTRSPAPTRATHATTWL